jgi:hypothetical protein
MRPKQLLTVLGRLEIERAYYVCPHCHQGQSPRDRELDVEGVACSPGVRRRMAVVGSESSFEQGREQLELLAGIAVTAKAVERQAEAIGADIEAATDKEGRPVRDEDSTTYVAAIETAEEFGLRLYSEAWRRGWSRADKKVVIGDGAVWLWNIADQHFPGAIQIVDLYHARQHLWDLSAKLFPDDDPARKRCCRLSGRFEDYWEARSPAA